jgi:hypothetical protein
MNVLFAAVPPSFWRYTNPAMTRHFQKPCATIRDILDSLPASTRPAGLVVFEVRQRKVCKPLDKMCHRGRAFYYGLARMQADKAEVLNPDCEKDWPAAKLPRVKVGGYAPAPFQTAPAWSAPLEPLAKQPWQLQVIYRLKDCVAGLLTRPDDAMHEGDFAQRKTDILEGGVE